MHEYQLTPYSLLAAVSIGLKSEEIVVVLGRLSKNELPAAVVSWIRECTRQVQQVPCVNNSSFNLRVVSCVCVVQLISTHGRVKLVLQHNKFFLESQDVIKTICSLSENYKINL